MHTYEQGGFNLQYVLCKSGVPFLHLMENGMQKTFLQEVLQNHTCCKIDKIKGVLILNRISHDSSHPFSKSRFVHGISITTPPSKLSKNKVHSFSRSDSVFQWCTVKPLQMFYIWYHLKIFHHTKSSVINIGLPKRATTVGRSVLLVRFSDIPPDSAQQLLASLSTEATLLPKLNAPWYTGGAGTTGRPSFGIPELNCEESSYIQEEHGLKVNVLLKDKLLPTIFVLADIFSVEYLSKEMTLRNGSFR